MSLTFDDVDDYITYILSFLWLVLLIISLVQLFLEILRYRKLKKEHLQHQQQFPDPPPFDTPLHLRPTPLPTSHSISSLSHVYMEDGILNVRLGNPRIVAVNPSHRDWNNPSAFIDRPAETPHVALSKLQIDAIAPVITFVNKPNEAKLTCVICLDTIHKAHRIRNLPCAHSFHAKCILVWLQRANRCPCCAKRIIPRNPEDVLTLPALAPEPQHNMFGVGEGLVTEGDERHRHDGLWSFSNERTNGRRGRNELRGRSNRNLYRDDRREETPGFEELLEVDYNDGDGAREVTS